MSGLDVQVGILTALNVIYFFHRPVLEDKCLRACY
jgi:hypothetical protein